MPPTSPAQSTQTQNAQNSLLDSIDTKHTTASVAEHQAAVAKRGVKFARDNAFQVELKKRVDDYFKTTGKPRRDCWQLYLKTAIIMSVFIASYLLLVFVATAWWVALPLAIILGLATAAIGLNIQHDGGHEAYSERPWVNKIMAKSLDFIGGSSYNWHWKHGVFHHTYCNITGHDTDIDLGAMGRLSPHQKHYPFHRLQHIYIWPLYGFLAVKWHWFDDFFDYARGTLGGQKFPRPKGWDLFLFFAGKAFFFTIAMVIPLMFHSVGTVILFYLIAAGVVGVVLAIVFQLAHCVEAADFPMPDENTSRMENAWAVHQVETTVDFGRRSKVMAWLLGGLNFQVEHHLLPKICHINFPALSNVVEQTCKDFGIRYNEHTTFAAGIASHYRWLKEMGRAPVKDSGSNDKSTQPPAAGERFTDSAGLPAT